MPRGGVRGKAGRPQGSVNRLSKVTIERARNSGNGELPHEFLLRIARGEEIDGTKPTFEQRMDAASVAAPYFAPKLAAIEQKIEQEVTGVISSTPMTMDDWDKQYATDAGDLGAATGAADRAD